MAIDAALYSTITSVPAALNSDVRCFGREQNEPVSQLTDRGILFGAKAPPGTTSDNMQQYAQDCALAVGHGGFHCIDRWLLQHHGCSLVHVASIPAEKHLQPAQLTRKIIKLATDNNTVAFVGRAPDHAFAIRVDEAGACWLLDSLRQGPLLDSPAVMPPDYALYVLRNDTNGMHDLPRLPHSVEDILSCVAPPPYHERQNALNCMVHAVNAAAGHHAVHIDWLLAAKPGTPCAHGARSCS